jgi:hypothetical protein
MQAAMSINVFAAARPSLSNFLENLPGKNFVDLPMPWYRL